MPTPKRKLTVRIDDGSSVKVDHGPNHINIKIFLPSDTTNAPKKVTKNRRRTASAVDVAPSRSSDSKEEEMRCMLTGFDFLMGRSKKAILETDREDEPANRAQDPSHVRNVLGYPYRVVSEWENNVRLNGTRRPSGDQATMLDLSKQDQTAMRKLSKLEKKELKREQKIATKLNTLQLLEQAQQKPEPSGKSPPPKKKDAEVQVEQQNSAAQAYSPEGEIDYIEN